MVLLIVAAALLVGAVVYQLGGEWWDRRRYPAPGQYIDGLHVRCAGTGAPAVVLEAGIAASSVGWMLVGPRIAEFAKVCSYDRPGFAWSRRAAEACGPDRFVRDLDRVVDCAGTPVILVGHSFGGMLVRLYASRYPEKVLGMVLVDPALVQEWARPNPRRRGMLERGIRLSQRGAWLARFGVVRLALTLASLGARPVARVIAHLTSGRGGALTTQRLAREVSKLPPGLLPIVKAHWSRPEGFLAMADHLTSLPSIAAAVEHLPVTAPLTVISGGHLSAEQLAEHAALAAASPRGRHIVASGSAHWIHFDEPELIVEAVREMAAHDHG